MQGVHQAVLPTLLLSAVEIPHHHGYQLPGPAVPALTLIPQTLPPSGPIYHNHQTPMPLQATSAMHMWLPLPPSLVSQGLDESSSFEGPPAGPPPNSRAAPSPGTPAWFSLPCPLGGAPGGQGPSLTHSQISSTQHRAWPSSKAGWSLPGRKFPRTGHSAALTGW